MRFHTIVANPESLQALRAVEEAIRLVAPGGTIHVLSTLPSRSPSDAAAEETRGTITTLRQQIEPGQCDATLLVHVRRGNRAEETVRLAVEANADLIVVGAFEPESRHTVPRILEWAACSVLVIAPNRERAEREGIWPHFRVCSECEAARSRRTSPSWLCEEHADATQRMSSSLDPGRRVPAPQRPAG